ncbi:ROK family protein [Bacillus lacus]|uniref:ROK family protein n=1 Tax=Metabacillus lacus TaxID=1983721 RepID=A0A7X2IY64_9BACI|nr:ROK family transcriptional regulator [Metabacillus lacus]MRX71769.1 ROK family protein [Metabacillus lacus]
MGVTWNQHVVKKENKAIVLNLILNSSPISRADTAQKSGLNKGTVSSLVAELLEEQLIYESGPGISSGGRRPVMLLFNKGAGFAIGIDLGVNYILGVLTDISGGIIERVTEKYENYSFDETLNHIKNVIKTLMKAAPPSPYGVIGIGLGAPGIVNHDGDILLAPNLGWSNVSLQKHLEDAFHIPVLIENEANAGAYGEKKFGAGQRYNNLIYVSAGIGIGAGIIINGELFRGSRGYSGELGHMTIDRNGEVCRCGNKGCWELYASEQALLTKARSLYHDIPVSLDILMEYAGNGDRKAIGLFEDIGRNIGIGIVNSIHAFNPQQIIIGNRLAGARKWLEPAIHDEVSSFAQSFHQSEINVTFSDLSIPSTALGVAAHTAENFLKSRLNLMNQ